MHSLRLICWGHRPWGAPVAPQQLEPGGEQAAGGQKHSRLGKRLFRSPPPSQKGGGGFQPQPRCELGCSHPRCELGCSHPCLPPPVPVLCDRRPAGPGKPRRGCQRQFLPPGLTPLGPLIAQGAGRLRDPLPPPSPGLPAASRGKARAVQEVTR